MLFHATSIFDQPWETLLSWSLYEAVYIGGLIVALFTWRKHPAISLVVITAMAGLLWTTVKRQWEQAQPDYYLEYQNMSMEDRNLYHWQQGIPYTVVPLMLAVTAMIARRSRNPVIVVSSGEEAPHE